MPSVKLSRAYNWELPYPVSEHESRIMCGDPIATAYCSLTDWITAQNFKPEVPIQKIIQCLWANHYGNSSTAWEIITDQGHLPADIPDYILDQMWVLYASAPKTLSISVGTKRKKLFP